MSGENGGNGDGKTDAGEGGEVVSLEEARRRAEERAKAEATGAAPPQPVDASGLLQPIVAAIAMELSKVADADGTVRLGGEDEAAKQKTAAVLRGLGAGLGAMLGDAFSKWAEKMVTQGQVKVETNPAPAPATTAPTTAPTDDPEKKS